MSKNNNGVAFVAGMLVGGILGTVAGVLIAPRSGRETRRLLKKSADALPEMTEDLSATVQLQADRWSESARRNWSDTLDRLKEAITAGIEASQSDTSQLPSPRNITADSTPSKNHF